MLAIPSILAAVVGIVNHRSIRTPNGKTIAYLVADIHARESTAQTEFPPESTTKPAANGA